MKNQVLFSSKDKNKKLECRLLQVLFGALRVKVFVSKVNSDRKEFALLGANFFLLELTPILKGFVIQGSKQEVTKAQKLFAFVKIAEEQWLIQAARL